ncbi:MAG: twin-arginine translocase subunit TatC [Nitrospirae bacterium]|nr:twin-arginine translocase subunit TatC [Nitrospirota bacterium]
MAENKLPFTEHLDELRKRIIVSVVALLVSFAACFYYSENIYSLMLFPWNNTLLFSFKMPFIALEPAKNPDLSLYFQGLAEPIWMHLKISLVAAFIISSPVIFYEVWRFISPGLVSKEKKYALPFVLIAAFLFLIGALFCFFLMLPFAVQFLLTYKTENLKPIITVGNYMDFCLKLILAFGVIFELPVVLVFLTKAGIVTTEFLAKSRKYWIVLAFVIAGIVTPTVDLFNQTLMALPMIVLYEAGILAARVLKRKESN